MLQQFKNTKGVAVAPKFVFKKLIYKFTLSVLNFSIVFFNDSKRQSHTKDQCNTDLIRLMIKYISPVSSSFTNSIN